ncbi:hypothetical protein [Sinorhizobium sp. BJ1]|uniref:hypothetical protein n=1 Tax=Sinorhizobium sp. BJ1 TaxID=2035455 RepID=UPI000BE9372E|nr:hypothetical protein [Sinorhizobium sp. BJ1]PDT79975.1 hypothetical protein CO676_30480 [Sinorhizobium sp. BJ1]
MTYRIKAIPTVYNHVQFRSRLEARWAAFFDLCGWEWDYEPFDLDGWAPDFLLKGKTKALVEVKPIDFRGDDKQLIRQAKAKAKKAFDAAEAVAGIKKPIDEMNGEEFEGYLAGRIYPPEYEILVIGNGPFKTDWWAKWSLGVMALQEWNVADDIADMFFGADGGPHFDYAARWGSYAYRIGGQYDGDHHLHSIGSDRPEELWREAGNIVQWQAKRAA